MTREQEITTMGAHAARTSETGPTTSTTSTATTVARIATTTLAVAVTGVVGGGTALAHDDGGGRHENHGHHTASVTSGDRADEARAEAQRTVRDTLADLGLSLPGTSDPDSADQQDSPDAQEPSSADHDSSGRSDGHEGDADDAPSHPSSGASRTSTQPITASSGTSQLPAVGESRTVPIR